MKGNRYDSDSAGTNLKVTKTAKVTPNGKGHFPSNMSSKSAKHQKTTSDLGIKHPSNSGERLPLCNVL